MLIITVDRDSDTLTKPLREMRAFMCDAEVGDERKEMIGSAPCWGVSAIVQGPKGGEDGRATLQTTG